MDATRRHEVSTLPWMLRGAFFLLLSAIGLQIYAPSLNGTFLGDDLVYIARNPAVHALDVGALLDPSGQAAEVTANYAPVHLLLHSLQWQRFGPATRPYRITNVLAHAFTAVMLALFFASLGIPRSGALIGSTLFFLHPGNVESVAWIFQLKTLVSMSLVLGALLVRTRAPALGVVLFGLALLTKITAALGLPVALILEWVWPAEPARRRATRLGLGAWIGMLAAVSIPEFVAFGGAGEFRATVDTSLGERIRFVFEIGARYLWMAASGLGLSASHAPDLEVPLMDPRWWVGLAFAVFATWRSAVSLRARTPEAVLWAFAAAGFLPVSQVLPFRFPIADRYLYTLLPAGIGLLALAARPAFASIDRAVDARDPLLGRDPKAWLVLLAFLALSIHFGLQSEDRVRVYRSNSSMALDSARNYPNGVNAYLLAAMDAAKRGDADATATALRGTFARGLTDFQVILDDPLFAPFVSHPGIRGVVDDMARWHIGRLEAADDPTPRMFSVAARAMVHFGRLGEARATVERGLAAYEGDEDLTIALRAISHLESVESAPGREAE